MARRGRPAGCADAGSLVGQVSAAGSERNGGVCVPARIQDPQTSGNAPSHFISL